MTEPIAFLNGQYIPAAQAALSVTDLGVVAGASATEMVRTFRHRLFRLEQHLERLRQSLELMGIELPLTWDDLTSVAERVTATNAQLLREDEDLGLVMFVTAGHNLTYLGAAGRHLASRPTVCVHSFPLPFELWADQYETGLHLVTTSVGSLPDNVIDARIKHRNRLHWRFADREARLTDPTATALLQDQEGNLTETATGNLCVVEGSTILSPPQHVLEGVSRDVIDELAASLGLVMAYTRLTPDDLARSHEAFVTSTPTCLLPVTRFNGTPVGSGRPGPIFEKLLHAWSDLVDLDLRQQMRSGAQRRRNRSTP